jgi:ATP-dependent DNA helicase PIF1
MPKADFRALLDGSNLKEVQGEYLKSCALTPEQMAPAAPPIKADPLKSYLTLTAMNRPRPEYLLSDLSGLPPERNPRYAKKKPLPFELDADQANALRVILDPVNRFVVLIGKAGTGKSTVIGALEAKEHVAKTATTGRAAMNINGITLDRLFSYDRLYDQTRSERKLAENMEACPHIIVIDEASMIGIKMMNYIYRIAIRFDKRIILVGDWAQASPVKDDWPVGSQLLSSCIVVKLTQVHRQSQGPYLAALDSLRQGEVTDLVREVFKPCMVQVPPEDDRYIRLFATNRTTDSYNSAKLSMGELSQRNSVGFSADLTDLRQSRYQLEYPMEPEVITRILEDSPFATVERFKAGARVVVTMNERVEGDDATPAFVNGDAGLLEHFIDDKGVPFEDPGASNPFMPTPVKIPYGAVVKLDRTGETVSIPYQIFQAYEANGDPIYSIRGMPLRLGWAVTIHRAQGMTVDKAFVDVGSVMAMIGESKHGLVYVALSRTRTLEGLQIFRWDDAAVFCAPVIKPYI